MSERSFRRYRRRYEEEGLEGLFDRRLGKASVRRVPVDRAEWVLEEYRIRHVGWTVKHFHDHLRDPKTQRSVQRELTNTTEKGIGGTFAKRQPCTPTQTLALDAMEAGV